MERGPCGTDRWYVFDWETAGNNDPLFDLVTMFEGLAWAASGALGNPGDTTANSPGRPPPSADRLRQFTLLFQLGSYAWAHAECCAGNERAELQHAGRDQPERDRGACLTRVRLGPLGPQPVVNRAEWPQSDAPSPHSTRSPRRLRRDRVKSALVVIRTGAGRSCGLSRSGSGFPGKIRRAQQVASAVLQTLYFPGIRPPNAGG